MSELMAAAPAGFGWGMALEPAATVLAVVYLLLAIRQHIACWYAAFVSTGIFMYIFLEVNLYMESLLQVYYLVMAVYGWQQWRRGGAGGRLLPVSTWPGRRHAVAIALVLSATAISGTLLSGTEQRLAYVDSFTTWGAIVTTWMAARKILENWLYWLVIDSVSIYLYLDRELYFTALLFAAYLVIVCFGFVAWLKSYRRQALAEP